MSRLHRMASFSSDSEADEFYDATDVTPVRPEKDPGKASDLPAVQPSITSSLIAEQEALLERLRSSEECRRKEEQDISEKLAKLEELKRAEQDRLEAATRAHDNESRRRKLEEMRGIVEGDLSPEAAPPKPPRLFIHDVDVSQSGGQQDDSLVKCSSASDIPLAEEVNKHEKNLFSEFNISDETININVPESCKKIHSKNIEVAKPGGILLSEVPVRLDSEESETRSPDDNVCVTLEQEPDLIQSTKTRSLERAGEAPPVAPPRRKKKNRASSGDADMDTSRDPSPVAGTVEHLSNPSSAVYSLTKGLEFSLDLRSATSGSRLVTASEDASARAEKGTEEEDYPQPKKPQKAAVSQKKSSSLQRAEGGKSSEDEKTASLKRPRTNSGSRFLTDKEILDKVSVLNLDTGEKVALSNAEDKLPQGVNPLSLHIMRRTKEYSSDSSLHKGANSDDEDRDNLSVSTNTIHTVKPAKKRRKKIRKLLGKTVNKLRSVADEVLHGEESNSEDEELPDGRRMIKVKASSSHKGPYDFDLLVPVQELSGEHVGAVWTMKCSPCGKLLATGGQDNLLRVWVLKDAYSYFDDMRQKYSEASKVSPAPSEDSISSQTTEAVPPAESQEEEEFEHAPFVRKPFCVYKGHTADLLDVAWSKNYFILSSSMDKTVRLWHVSRKECLCCFQHIDFVTAITFHPKDDRYFLSGSLDGKLRLWNIPEKKVALWNEVSGQTKLITTANFCDNGRYAVVGTYDGRCLFYSTDQLKYHTQIHVRSTRGKNARGRKITGIDSLPGQEKVLVTSNDSRIRLYDLRDLTLTCKYKGCANNSSQIKANFSSNGMYIICGSEDQFVYIWRTQHNKSSTSRKDRNDYWEGIKAHTAVVTAAIFASNPGAIIKPQFEFLDSDEKEAAPTVRGEVIISADFTGAIKVFLNKFKPGSGV